MSFKKIIIVLSCLFILSGFATAQKIEKLKKAKNNETIAEGKAIMYGLFIQRLGFTSGGFPQEIRILNMETEKIYSFQVKPTMKSSRENIFCYTIPPGRYLLLHYFWTQSKWYGGQMHIEPIYKNIDAGSKEFEIRFKKGLINEDELEFYTFSIVPNIINYMGTWDFQTGLVTFNNQKDNLDKRIKDKYKKIDFSQAWMALPE